MKWLVIFDDIVFDVIVVAAMGKTYRPLCGAGASSVIDGPWGFPIACYKWIYLEMSAIFLET